MKSKLSPGAWLAIGFLVFPIACFVNEVVGWIVVGALGLLRDHHSGQFGWGGFAGVFLGAPLGVVSALCRYGWQNKRFVPARFTAAIGGLFIGGGWLALLWGDNPFVWVGDFGFAVTPLAWAAGLVGFGLLARHGEPPLENKG